MSQQVIWGKLKFKVDGKVARGIEGFSASLSKKKDKDSSSKKKFTEAEEISFNITSSFLTGGNPLKDYNFLKTWIGFNKKGYQLKVNEGKGSNLTAWRGGKFHLTNVEMSNTTMDNYGRIVACEIKLTFEENPVKSCGTKKKVKKYRKNSKVSGAW